MSKNDSLWEQYSKVKNTEQGGPLREKLILEYSHLIKYVAGRLNIYFGGNVEYEDMVSYGIFGLIDAIDKFDIYKGVKFETYATLRIKGAIIDNIRRLDWVPRTLRQKGKELEKAYLELEQKLARVPKEEEVAEKLNMSLEELYKTMNDVNISHVVSLDEFLEQNYEPADSNGETTDAVDRGLEVELMKKTLADSIDKLNEKEKNVISLYYFEELTLKEISVIMKLSESRISQIHSKAITKLRGKLGAYREVFY